MPSQARSAGGSHGWRPILVLAALFFAAHLPFLAPSLEDIDSVNFALGVRDFDPARHRPHPPGYPVFIGLAKTARLVLDEPQALAIWGALLGGLAALPLFALFRALDESRRGRQEPGAGSWLFENSAVWATVMVLANPLYWINSSRPMSDVPGLAASLTAQALLMTAFARQSEARRASQPADIAAATFRSGRLILGGALASAIALGFRSQAGVLTLPLLVLVIVDRAGRGGAAALVGSAVWFAVGIAAWMLPLFAASGGPGAYLAALAGQGQEDWTAADIIATHMSASRLVWALVDTFIRPWGSLVLGVGVTAAAACGGFVLAARNRRALAAVAALAIPYALFHVLFQETSHTRYALPLVPVVAYLAVTGLAALPRVRLAATAGPISLVMLALGIPTLASYARDPSPSARALADMAAAAKRERLSPEPVLRLPQALAIAWRDEPVSLRTMPTLRSRQWLGLVQHWRDGNAAPVWYVAEPERSGLDNRHDLALIDPASRRLVRSYRWPFDPLGPLGGVRPSELDWYVMSPPGWMALEGWALTPRLAGLARADGKGPSLGGVTALVRRRPAPVVLLIGGRHLGAREDPDVRFTLSMDGKELTSWTASAANRFFLRDWQVDTSSSGGGPFAVLRIAAEASDGSGRVVNAAIEQFDAQAAGSVMAGFDEGWHEQEYDPGRGIMWRWTSGSSTLRILASEHDVVIRLRGESPLRYYDTAPSVRVRAAGRTLDEFRPASDFTREIIVPASALVASGGKVVLETDQTHVPDERNGNGDLRRLGLRVYDLQVLGAAHGQ
ncbi:MAG: protein O-mannosyl-transferase family [Vicinamibacterales bacterium]